MLNRMQELKIRRRHRLRQKEISAIAERLDAILGTSTFTADDPVQMAEIYGLEQTVYILGDEIVAIEIEGQPFLYLKGIMKYGASKRFVTVDMGAVRFVTNGADIMGPGIVDGDRTVRAGDLVWVRDQRYGKPLAIGRSAVDGSEFGSKKPGKFIISLFHIGDRLWKLSEELSGK